MFASKRKPDCLELNDVRSSVKLLLCLPALVNTNTFVCSASTSEANQYPSYYFVRYTYITFSDLKSVCVLQSGVFLTKRLCEIKKQGRTGSHLLRIDWLVKVGVAERVETDDISQQGKAFQRLSMFDSNLNILYTLWTDESFRITLGTVIKK